DKEAEVAGRTDGDEEVEQTIDALGLTLSALTDEVRGRFKLPKDAKGLVVTKVEGDGPAAEKNIRPGDLVVEVSQEEVSNPKDVVKKVGDAAKAGRQGLEALLRE
ncbi:MAG: PDZ domain-containing protein, partial [Rhodospirillaceae bacterium]